MALGQAPGLREEQTFSGRFAAPGKGALRNERRSGLPCKMTKKRRDPRHSGIPDEVAGAIPAGLALS